MIFPKHSLGGLVRRWGPWAVLVAVAAVALSIGLSRTSHPTLDARVQHIAGQVRCPVCNGESAAASQTAPAVAIRSQIRQDLLAGQTQGQILQSLVQAYGSGILEKPRATGIGLVVWVAPVVGFVAGLAGLGLAFVRWRNRSDVGTEDHSDGTVDPEPAVVEPALAAVAVSSSVPSAAVSVPSPPAEAGNPPPGLETAGANIKNPRSSRLGWVLAGAGVAIVAANASWAVVASSGSRLPGQTITGQSLGTVPSNVAAELAAADKDATNHDAIDALKEYRKVLATDPNQVQALTGEGWLLAETQQPALLQQGVGLLAHAETVDSTYAPAHLYRGIALLSEDDYSDSVPELQWYLAHNPDPGLTSQVRTALAQAQAAEAATRTGASTTAPTPLTVPTPQTVPTPTTAPTPPTTRP